MSALKDALTQALIELGLPATDKNAEVITQHLVSAGEDIFKSPDGFLYPSVSEAVDNEGIGITLTKLLGIPHSDMP